MTQHVEHFEDFTKAHVESWLKILRYVHLLRTRKCLAAVLVSELIDEDKKSKKQRGKSRAWIRRRSSKGCYNNIVKELSCRTSNSCDATCIL